MINEVRMGQIIREAGYQVQCSARRLGDPFIVSMKVDDAWVRLGTLDDIKLMTVRQLRALIKERAEQFLWVQSKQLVERMVAFYGWQAEWRAEMLFAIRGAQCVQLGTSEMFQGMDEEEAHYHVVAALLDDALVYAAGYCGNH